jgi:hypothetical protein
MHEDVVSRLSSEFADWMLQRFTRLAGGWRDDGSPILCVRIALLDTGIILKVSLMISLALS